MSLWMTAPLDWKVVVLSLMKMPFTLSVFADSNHHITVNFVCGRSESVSLWSFSDSRNPSALNPLAGTCRP
jgi:hypothetical protein